MKKQLGAYLVVIWLIFYGIINLGTAIIFAGSDASPQNKSLFFSIQNRYFGVINVISYIILISGVFLIVWDYIQDYNKRKNKPQ